MKIFCIIIGILAVNGVYGEIPKCKYEDEACFITAAHHVLENHPGGLPEVNLLAIDPFPLKTFNLQRNPSSPVNVELKLTDATMDGLKGLKFSTFKAFAADLSGRNSITATLPSLIIKGKYTLDGNVLVLPIKGNGNAEIKFINLKVSYSFDLKKVVKDGQTFVAVEHVKMQLEPENVQFQFDGLFDGDASLQKTTNDFINSNWKEIYQELQTGITKPISLVIKAYINKFLEHKPYADHFQ
ncbi:protein takeout-like [Musca autumnalis]|uniref:protein takeout-like n=1 Tax=Musca autumnalis TaxID=221902 RepID=UPI003CF35A43